MSASRQAVLVAFLIGCIAGVLAGSRFQRRAFGELGKRNLDTSRSLKRLSGELGLDAKQQEAVKAALERRRADMQALQTQTLARMQEIRTTLRAEIEPVLTPDQKTKFEALKKKWDLKHAQEEPSR